MWAVHESHDLVERWLVVIGGIHLQPGCLHRDPMEGPAPTCKIHPVMVGPRVGVHPPDRVVLSALQDPPKATSWATTQWPIRSRASSRELMRQCDLASAYRASDNHKSWWRGHLTVIAKANPANGQLAVRALAPSDHSGDGVPAGAPRDGYSSVTSSSAPASSSGRGPPAACLPRFFGLKSTETPSPTAPAAPAIAPPTPFTAVIA